MKSPHDHDLPSDQELDQRLRKGRPSASPPENFTERVMDEIRTERIDRSTARSQTAIGFPWLKLAFGIAWLVLMGTFLSTREPTGDSPEIAKTTVPEPMAVDLPNISTETIRELPAKIEDPLELELQRMVADGRNAVRFLASNFLPEEEQ